ncbi:cysteine hydrolase [Sphaerochaeta sp. PS]|uniref:cysteine hydrolase family protein n=1 Tax=Sphaerochaeta sp. PS TaxID=3076336 RepID=UPI0028A39133|nr:cysteine hydrolase [Sphaerochaeta sp. PS]MDT4762754.1 cysteine hydrolase [Sphaerochaeta sp. PS]
MHTVQSTDCGNPPSRDLLIVVDMQKDFVFGSLGTQEAQAVVQKVRDKVALHTGELWFTLDTHQKDYLGTAEGKALPVEHCIKGTEGHELVDKLKAFTSHARLFEKPTFGSVEMAKALEGRPDIDKVTLVGVCTDICVISNALLLKAFRPGLAITVDSACCAGTTPENHEASLVAMKSCQIQVI